MKDVLQDVFRITRIPHPAPDEMAEPGTLTQDGCSEVRFSFDHRVRRERRFHTSVDVSRSGILWSTEEKLARASCEQVAAVAD
ncbi:MAG: hypothetical protein WCA85_25170 [Paraburkholderia sp.]|uniref:hypothetical protein n=1 Tax=Paraburkholderia sp. TaxID=1926495 RepID=UPI003C4627A3